jgi:hypothetical protein
VWLTGMARDLPDGTVGPDRGIIAGRRPAF